MDTDSRASPILDIISVDSETDGVSITLEWTPQVGVSYNVTVIPAIDVIFTERAMSVNLSLLYNTVYNVSVVATSLCGQLIRATFIELHYGEQQFVSDYYGF